MDEFLAGLALAAIGAAAWTAYMHPVEFRRVAKVLWVISMVIMLSITAYSMGFGEAVKRAEAAGLAAGSVVVPNTNVFEAAMIAALVFVIMLTFLPRLGIVNKSR
jgi:hypothetical protein